jgi:predicted Zn-dependent peptidase
MSIAVLLCALPLTAQVRLPQYTRQVLPNGVVLDVMPRRDVPLVTMRLLVRGGVESEPADLGGIAAATAEALRRGTVKRSSDQFSNELDALGATFSTGTDLQSTSVTMELLAKDFNAGLGLMADAVLRPTFPEAEVKKLLAQRIDASKAIKDNPGRAASEYFRVFFFGPQHPYGTPADELTYGRMNRETIAGYHKRMYVGRNMIFVIAGDIDAQAVVSAVTKAFGGLDGGQAYEWKKASTPGKPGARVAIINKPDATQTNFQIGFTGIDRTHPDRVPLWLVNTLFGGRFTSILNDELRVNSGLTYGAGSYFDQSRLPGRVTISSFTKTESTGKAIDMAISLMKKLGENGITAEQLSSAKSYVKGIYPSEQLETPDQLADILADIELFGLNRGEVDDLFSRIDSVTVEQANEVARKYFLTDRIALLLVGNAGQIAGDVKKYDPKAVEVQITRPGLRVVE